MDGLLAAYLSSNTKVVSVMTMSLKWHKLTDAHNITFTFLLNGYALFLSRLEHKTFIQQCKGVMLLYGKSSFFSWMQAATYNQYTDDYKLI